MPNALRIPITNSFGGGHFTMEVSLGADAVPLNLLLDTGAGLLVVDGGGYDPSTDSAARSTRLLQAEPFESGSFAAAVVRTSIGLSPFGGAAAVVLADANVAVTYQETAGLFGNADGILGLAYAALDTGLLMPSDTLLTKYTVDQFDLGEPAELQPFISQLTSAGLAPEVFAFAVSRSQVSLALADPASDPVNNGWLILGGGADCTDLYSGGFSNVAVVHPYYYHTNLLAVQVGGQTIDVPPAAIRGRAFSNAIVDSGAGVLKLDQGLYDKVIAAFAVVRPAFAVALLANASGAGAGCDQRTLTLADWPPLTLVFQGGDGTPVPVDVMPGDYWQFDCGRNGLAVAMLTGDDGTLSGQSILGLPLFTSHFVVFDRSANAGHGVIGFARRKELLLV